MSITATRSNGLAATLLVLVGWACAPPPAPAPAPPDAPEPPAPARPPEPAPEPEPTPAPGPSHVVMVSFDGMRYDFPDRVATPNLDWLAEAGARSTGLIPAYPSKTFPNYYTLATGLRPGRHGIVDNAFYDPVLDDFYTPSDRDAVRDPKWYGGEPLWVTAERQGVKAASYFWVGTEAPIGGVHPSYFKYYDHDFPDAARVDTVLHWLALPAPDRPRLVMLYFSLVDDVAHRQGPDAPAVDSAIVAADRLLGRLLDGIAALPHGPDVHVIVVSDHGMEAAPAEQVIVLEGLVDLEGVRVVHNTTQALLYFDGDEARMWDVYEALGSRLEHAAVHLRQELPARWHYRDNPRAGDLVVVAEPGWVIRSPRGRPWTGGGMHGWDPYYRPMHGIFIAAGRGIAPRTRLPALESIHVYPFVARLLGLEPAPGIDGRLEVLEPALAPVVPAGR